MMIYILISFGCDLIQILTSVCQTHVSTLEPVMIGLRHIFVHAPEDLKE